MIRRLRPLPAFDPGDLKTKVAADHGVHPLDVYLKPGRFPHIWCPGCGLGVVLTTFLKGLELAGLKPEDCSVVSGIGCAGRVAGYLNMDTYHTTHGRPIPFATGLKLAQPNLAVTVFSGDGDLFAIGGNHFIHAARRNVDLKVICVNNFNYGMTGGQLGPTTPVAAKTTTSPYGNHEHPFNLCHVAHAAGAVYVARWTAFHARQLVVAVAESMQKKGFTFIEAIAPCPVGFGRPNKLGTGREEMKYYREKSVVRNGADPSEVGIDLKGEIVVGKFVDFDKPTFFEVYESEVQAKLRKAKK